MSPSTTSARLLGRLVSSRRIYCVDDRGRSKGQPVPRRPRFGNSTLCRLALAFRDNSASLSLRPARVHGVGETNVAAVNVLAAGAGQRPALARRYDAEA